MRNEAELANTAVAGDDAARADLSRKSRRGGVYDRKDEQELGIGDGRDRPHEDSDSTATQQ